MTEIRTICLLGFGEVGQILGADLGRLDDLALRAYDVLFDDPASAPSEAAARMPQVEARASATDAARGADLVISAVTAARDLEAAGSVAGALAAGAWFLDVNSVSPETRTRVADVVEKAGGRYVEAAVMAPISPRRIASPMLLGGPHAQSFVAAAAGLGFTGARAFSDSTGLASATKMCRSVIVKGIESLLTESLTAARHYGVEREVLESLRGLANNDDWEGFARYMISRSLEHGTRRAEEMREVATTVGDAGVAPLMSSACAKRQELAAAVGLIPGDEDLYELLDAILESRA
jgi:3-hydroxyisobutyrate dehydrogenase-like beta-hydroxyacid dehydrogenase